MAAGSCPAAVPLVYGIGKTGPLNVGVLVVGPESSQLASLCTAIEKESTFPSITVMRSPQLPLSATGRARQFHYDVVVLAADATDCRSLDALRRSMSCLDVHYRCGRSCVTVIGADVGPASGTSALDLSREIGFQDIPVLYGSCKVRNALYIHDS
eukprot:scpid16372/ scgid2104/ 